MRGDRDVHSWRAEGNPTLTEDNKTILCCTDNFVPLAEVTQQQVTPSIRHDPVIRNLVPDTEEEETLLKLLEIVPECSTEDGAVLGQEKIPLAGKKAGRGDPIAQTEVPSVVTDAVGVPYAEVKTASVLETRANGSKAKGDHNGFAHFPTDPN